jgi:hypothetical protein
MIELFDLGLEVASLSFEITDTETGQIHEPSRCRVRRTTLYEAAYVLAPQFIPTRAGHVS